MFTPSPGSLRGSRGRARGGSAGAGTRRGRAPRRPRKRAHCAGTPSMSGRSHHGRRSAGRQRARTADAAGWSAGVPGSRPADGTTARARPGRRARSRGRGALTSARASMSLSAKYRSALRTALGRGPVADVVDALPGSAQHGGTDGRRARPDGDAERAEAAHQARRGPPGTGRRRRPACGARPPCQAPHTFPSAHGSASVRRGYRLRLGRTWARLPRRVRLPRFDRSGRYPLSHVPRAPRHLAASASPWASPLADGTGWTPPRSDPGPLES
ncbi:hypothetical protein QBC98_003173 [Kitasatospora acidiphila]